MCHHFRFRERVEEVERRYQCVMIASLQDVKEAAEGLAIINRFRPMAARKALFPVFFIMINKVRKLYIRCKGECLVLIYYNGSHITEL